MNTTLIIMLMVGMVAVSLAVTIVLTLMASKAIRDKRNADAALTAFGITAVISSMIADFVYKDTSLRQGSRLNQTIERLFSTIEDDTRKEKEQKEDLHRKEIQRLERKIQELHGKVKSKR